MADKRYILAFDTSNEVIAVGIGRLIEKNKAVEFVGEVRIEAQRQSNTKLLSCVDSLMSDCGLGREDLECVCVGRGPGSFTGVRIAMATAKGISASLRIALIGLSTLDCIAWNSWVSGVRGRLYVVCDAMRKEVYPCRYILDDFGIERLDKDNVVKESLFVQSVEGVDFISGDGLTKYFDSLSDIADVRPKTEWTCTGRALLLCLQDYWRRGVADPFDRKKHDPAIALPVYTRLSDAEENERLKLSQGKPAAKNLITGVQDIAKRGAGVVGRIDYRPAGLKDSKAISVLEGKLMKSDAWSESVVSDDIGQNLRIWWVAEIDGEIVGYIGVNIIDGDMRILKLAVDKDHQRKGIAKKLVAKALEDAVNLAAERSTLEVRASNDAARDFYRFLGFEDIGTRKGYYSDGEDAFVMEASTEVLLQIIERDNAVAGMDVDLLAVPTNRDCDVLQSDVKKPLILAIESSCDETAAAITAGDGRILSNVVASQVDFHARFGGVVPEIASRKHIEAICGVADIALEHAARRMGVSRLDYRDLDAIGATYTPGLVGALVVGVAFAKGVSWGAQLPFIGVNHLEGHLYANKLDENLEAPFSPPAIVSLVSGGNTMLVHMKDWGDYEILGSTIDDAVGEAFDKIAKALGLEYPGGPAISKLALKGDAYAIDFPRAMLHSKDYRFSLSGLKTAVVTYIEKVQKDKELDESKLADICASFQQAVIDVQVAKAECALKQTGAKTFSLGGGVAANPALRSAYEVLCSNMGVELVMPPLSVCGDNAAMIALVALDRYKEGRFFDLDADAYAHSDLGEKY